MEILTIILGIDPGLQHTGWGVIKVNGSNISFIAGGVIHTTPKLGMPKRLLQLHTNLKEVIELYKPDEMAIEETFVNKNALSSLKLGHARGVLIVTGASHDIPISEYSPNLIKKSITGAGKADKNQIIAMIKILLPASNITNSDTADALATAICHANHRQIRNLM